MRHTHARTHAHTWISCSDSRWQTDNPLANTASLNPPLAAINTWASFGLCTPSKHFLTNTAIRSERTHLSPRKHRAITKDTGLSSCARTLWVAVRSSLGALELLMRECETKKGVEKARERTVCGRGAQMESYVVFSLLTHLSSPFTAAGLLHLSYNLAEVTLG